MDSKREAYLKETKEHFFYPWQKKSQSLAPAAAENKFPGKTVKDSASRTQFTKTYINERSEQFEKIWAAAAETLKNKYASIYFSIFEAICQLHPWIVHDESLIANFINRKTIELIDNKVKFVIKKSKNKNTNIDDIKWADLDLDFEVDEALHHELRCLPLRDTDIYRNCKLPSFLVDPFSNTPTRYDIYRILLKKYPEEFKAAQLTKNTSATKIAPLHLSELERLTDAELNHFESIILNIGREEEPQWVLLHQQSQKWILYTREPLPEGLAIPAQISSALTNQIVPFSGKWDDVLLSRILPFCHQDDVKDLNAYRSNIPALVLQQHTIEISCLAEQHTYQHAAQVGFTKAEPFSKAQNHAIYNAMTSSNPPLPSLLFRDIPLLKADDLMRAFDNGQLSVPADGSININDAHFFIAGMILAYHLKSSTISIKFEIPEELHEWLDKNLEIMQAFGLDSHLHACAARNRFLAYKHYQISTENRNLAWANIGQYISEYLKRPLDITQLQNIAQMGKKGLDGLFQYLSQEGKTAQIWTLDLDSQPTMPIEAYIELLSNKISDYRYRPLLNQLTLIYPEPRAEFLLPLLEILNTKGEIDHLYFDMLNPLVIEELTKYVQADKDFCLQIVIPKLDKKEANKNLVSSYKLLQNAILKNIRNRRQPELVSNTQTIERPLPIIPLKTDAPIQRQDWGDKIYLLASIKSIGLQQEVQQEVQQEQEQEAEQKSQEKAPKTKEITVFEGGDTYSRENLKGIQPELFNQWVGSDKDAPFLIQEIDAQAIAKLQEFKSLFTFGVDWQNTPGFRLKYKEDSGNRIFVLCFDEASFIEDMKEENSIFSIQMQKIKEAQVFEGNEVQFGLEGSFNITAWNKMAVSDVVINGKSPSEMDLLGMLEVSSPLKDFCLTNNKLQAFGQIFNRFGKPGLERFFALNQKILDELPEYIDIFYDRILMPLEDFAQCLEKTEVEAWTTAMKKLKSHPTQREVFLHLIDAHGENISKARSKTRLLFAETWDAYDRIINYIDSHDLTFAKDAFISAITANAPDINATQFLRRLYEVLQHTGNRNDSVAVQQEILDKLDEIDWHENGFYYACIHEHYRYWDESLKLNALSSVVTSDKINSYCVDWSEGPSQITDKTAYTLRYAAQKLKLNYSEFQQFKALITTNDASPEVLRLLTASIAIGVDTVEFIKPTSLGSLESYDLRRINDLLDLNANPLKKGLYQLKYEYLAPILKVLGNDQITLEQLNALGRAASCFKGDENKLRELVENYGFDSPITHAIPWLYEEPSRFLNIENQEQTQFLKQLESIDFDQQNQERLPDIERINALLATISSKETRLACIAQLVGEGCLIREQGGAFRLLNEAEKHLANDFYLSKTFRAENQPLLLKLFDKLAIKDGPDSNDSISELLKVFADLDRKNYHNELGQLLGLLLAYTKDGRCYNLEQLTGFLRSVFDETNFRTKPYPASYIKILLENELSNEESCLLNVDFAKLETDDSRHLHLQQTLQDINHTDLNETAKKSLVKLAVKENGNLPDIVGFYQRIKALPDVTAALSAYIDFKAEDLNLDKLSIIFRHSIANTALQSAYQIKALQLLEQGQTDVDDIVITLALVDGNNDARTIRDIKSLIQNLGSAQQNTLAEYYLSSPKPSLKELLALLDYGKKNLENKISYFEKVIQAAGKRNYSVDEADKVSIERVLDRFKLKHHQSLLIEPLKHNLLNALYYCNAYSDSAQLNHITDDELLSIIKGNIKDPRKVLAAMREMVLRKTGKWLNHTQMMVLLYQFTYPDSHLMLQIRTGEGKSLISFVSAAYAALNGKTVDIFSAKESLSLRDHAAFSSALDAFRIGHHHITASSSKEDYEPGAVHYTTIGNLSLFNAGHCWESNNPINIPGTRVAVLDEADHILLNEDTLFNYTASSRGGSVYNYDAWVYQKVYEYYDSHKESFLSSHTISEEENLAPLYAILQKAELECAPEQSTFFKQLIQAPPEIRNQMLVDLLKAAHTAYSLEQGVDFCVMSEHKPLGTSVSLDIRFAKVMINNQVMHGSTYSDLVQQFLHTRLNIEAIAKGETPDFFIEPVNEIALALTAEHVLKHDYTQLIGFTGTVGDDSALKHYRETYEIDHIIKAPTHQDVKTIFRAPIFADNAECQIDAIVAAINDNPEQAILITCKDDKEVERLSRTIHEKSGSDRPFLIDTNDRGLTEADIVKYCGKNGQITISSRMGRGTDINPENPELGLRVIRTYPEITRVVKQEQGRQGRNGAGGICQDIINYADIVAEWETLHSTNTEELTRLYNSEKAHLDTKLEKHNGGSKHIWLEISGKPKLKEQYLINRCLAIFKDRLQTENKLKLHQKNNLIAAASAAFMAELSSNPRMGTSERHGLNEKWLRCKKELEMTADLNKDKISYILGQFQIRLLLPSKEDNRRQSNPEFNVIEDIASIKAQLDFYQAWMRIRKPEQDQGKIKVLDNLFAIFQEMTEENIALLKLNIDLFQYISCDTWVRVCTLLRDDAEIKSSYNDRVAEFKSKHGNYKTSDINTISAAFVKIIQGEPDLSFIYDIIEQQYFDKNIKETLKEQVATKFDRSIVALCRVHMSAGDIVSFLSHLNDASIDYLKLNYKELIQHPLGLRPLFILAFHNTTYLPEIPKTDIDAKILSFLSRRPGYSEKEYERLNRKIFAIEDEVNRNDFVDCLLRIPPYASLKQILYDLRNLPSKNYGIHKLDLEKQINRIETITNTWINLLFNNSVLKSKLAFSPVDQERFNQLRDIFEYLSLDERESFLETLGNYRFSISTEELSILVNTYKINGHAGLIESLEGKKSSFEAPENASKTVNNNALPGFFVKK